MLELVEPPGRNAGPRRMSSGVSSWKWDDVVMPEDEQRRLRAGMSYSFKREDSWIQFERLEPGE